MATKAKDDKYKTYTAGVYEDSDRLKDLNSQSDYWNKQQLQNFTWDDSMVSSNTQNWLNQLNALQKPTWNGYSRQSDWDNIVNKITNMKDFSYDVNGDALYQQYKDQYSTQGKMAMMDTMGQAAALTGGYGNSYAQSVGQQTYQGYMQQLADKVPELYSLALSKYNSDKEDLYRQNDLHQNMFNNEYGMYRNDVSDYNTDRGYYSDMYNTGYARDYQTALDTNNSYNSNVASNRSYYTDAANQLANIEWGKYADSEKLAQAAIQIYNDNLTNQRNYDLADEEFRWKKDQSDLQAKVDSLTNQYVVNQSEMDKLAKKILSKDDFQKKSAKKYNFDEKAESNGVIGFKNLSTEYTIDGNTFNSYEEYVDHMIASAYGDGTGALNAATVMALREKYGL